MMLTPKQLQHFWRKWSAVCEAQKWSEKPVVESHRKAMLKRCGFDSLTHVDRGPGFDRVLAELGRLSDHIGLTIETEDESIGEARRIRHVIRTEIYPCIALYRDADTYLASVIKDKFGRGYVGQKIITLNDLTARAEIVVVDTRRVETASQLHQLLSTLSQRLNDLRNEACETIHQMKTRAGVPCDCAGICRPKAAAKPKGPREFKLDPNRTVKAKAKPSCSPVGAPTAAKDYDPYAHAPKPTSTRGTFTGD